MAYNRRVVNSKGDESVRTIDAKQVMQTAICLIVLVALCVGLFVVVPPAKAQAANLYKGASVWYGSYSTHWYELNGTTAYCADPHLGSPSSGTYTEAPIEPYRESGEPPFASWAVAGALYYGWDGPGFDSGDIQWPEYDWNGNPMGAEAYYAATHVLVSDFYSANGYIATNGMSSDVKAWFYDYILSVTPDGTEHPENVQAQIYYKTLDCVSHHDDPAYDGPRDFIAFWNSCYSIDTPSGIQTIVGYHPYGYVSLDKRSANSSVTDGNACYSLDGARYGVYSDSACTDGSKVGELVTDVYGNTNSLSVAAGDYWVKEISASHGYRLDPQVYYVNVVSGATAHVTSNEQPVTDPEAVGAAKQDRDTGEFAPQGGALLEGALFEFSFYAGGYYDETNLPATATRKWVLRTDDEGWALIQNGDELKVSGDEFYRNSDGVIVLPLGTVTACEIDAPEGYLLGDVETFISHVEIDDSSPFGAASVPVGYESVPIEGHNIATPAIVEDVIHGDADLTKRDMDLWKLVYDPMYGYEYNLSDWEFPEGDADFSGAVFEIINNNDGKVVSPQTGQEVPKGGVVCTIVTDETGYASTARSDLNGWTHDERWHGSLAYGDYIVRETVAPKGYLVNTTWRGHVNISEDGATVRIQ